MKIPTIFFHIGYQKYLELCLRQTSKNNRVILIGNEQNQHLGQLENVEHHLYKHFLEPGTSKFLDSYKHLHSGAAQFELFCFMRWIVVRNALKFMNIETFFYSDSDNLIYSDLDEVYKNLGSPDFALAVPQEQPPFRWVATGAMSYWNIDILDEFCDFMTDFYIDKQKLAILEEKWAWHKREGFFGGICDMSLMWHFVQQKEHQVLTKVQPDNTAFNININEPTNHYYSLDEYEVKEGDIKNIFFLEDKPYCKNLLTGEDVMFHNLQFQGGAKHLVREHTRGIS